MNKNSIFFKITLFFSLMIIIAHIIIYLGYSITKDEYVKIYVNNFMDTIHKIGKKNFEENNPNFNPAFRPQEMDMKGFPGFMPPPPPPPPKSIKIDLKDLNKNLNEYNFEISDINYTFLNEKGNLLAKDDMWRLYEYKGFKYFYTFLPFHNGNVIIKDRTKYIDKSFYILLLTILLNIVFISFYIFLIKKLKPLHNLKENIKSFSEGKLDIDTSCSGKDEIAEVSNQFNNAIKKIKELRESRNLFLRNIMHELKTPITKGKIIIDLMEDNKYQKNLRRAFFRLEFLINELAKIERFTSGNFSLNKKEYHINEIIDEATTLLMIDRDDIEVNVEDKTINVDFELFSIVIKNLLDNAIKYSDDKVEIKFIDKHILVINSGDELKKPLKEYLKPFNRDYEVSSGGLGLGLYIVDSILKSHNFSIDYKYNDKKNIFIINLT